MTSATRGILVGNDNRAKFFQVQLPTWAIINVANRDAEIKIRGREFELLLYDTESINYRAYTGAQMTNMIHAVRLARAQLRLGAMEWIEL